MRHLITVAALARDLLIGVPLICLCVAIELHRARAAERAPLAGTQEDWP